MHGDEAGKEVASGRDYKLLQMVAMLIILIVMIVSCVSVNVCVYVYVKIYQVVQFKYVEFMKSDLKAP